jgi:flagellar basal-body rod protein FlgF
MNQGTYPLAASMINQINRLDMISNNLANVNTNGFKEEGTTEGSFNYYLQRAKKENFTPSKINEVTNTVPKMDTRFIIGKEGPIMSTGNALDFALSSTDTFFKVRGENGETLYTRDGSFKNLNGMLVDSNGREVLDNANEPIPVEDGFENLISVSRISYNDLKKYKDNDYKVNNGATIDILEQNNGELLQGSIEKSNVNAVMSMVGLIDAQRRLDQAQKAVTTIDDINGTLIDKVGNNR